MMHHRIFSLSLSVVTLSLVAVACGGAERAPATESASESATNNNGDNDTAVAPPEGTPANGGSCIVQASSYDSSCNADSDCVGVPPGGDTCDPCHMPSGYASCLLSAVNASVAPTYLAALAAGFAPFQDQEQYLSCITQACPSGGAPRCDHGTCTIGASNVVYEDAGASDATTD